MANLKILHDVEGKTLTVWFAPPDSEAICEETGDEVILMKNKQGRVIGFEKLNFLEKSEPLRVAFEARARLKTPSHPQMASLLPVLIGSTLTKSSTASPTSHPCLEMSFPKNSRPQIDCLVYELHGLTEDEIKIVEHATA